MSKPDNPPAFPRPSGADLGMTLRDWFAGRAMQTFLAGATATEERFPQLCEYVAELSYQIADAMLAERAKP